MSYEFCNVGVDRYSSVCYLFGEFEGVDEV